MVSYRMTRMARMARRQVFCFSSNHFFFFKCVRFSIDLLHRSSFQTITEQNALFQSEIARLDFHLANCLDYIKSGMEAIIEDEVTSRFEAEELKNWNLLTRTNRYYEFISWRLSIIWCIGFIIRWFVLMPFRVFICFVGVSLKEKLLIFSFKILFRFLQS